MAEDGTTPDNGKARAKAKERADSAFREFFVALGYAISRWAHVDRELFDLCKFALHTTEDKTAAVFYRTPQVRGHLDIVDQLMKLSLRPTLLKDWKKIRDKIDKLLPFRNEIAHNPAMETVELTVFLNRKGTDPTPNVKQKLYEDPKQWWAIRPERTKTLLRKTRFVEAKREDIVAHITDVNELLSEISAFRRRLPKRPTKTRPVSSGQEAPRELDRGRNRPPNAAKP